MTFYQGWHTYESMINTNAYKCRDCGDMQIAQTLFGIQNGTLSPVSIPNCRMSAPSGPPTPANASPNMLPSINALMKAVYASPIPRPDPDFAPPPDAPAAGWKHGTCRCGVEICPALDGDGARECSKCSRR